MATHRDTKLKALEDLRSIKLFDELLVRSYLFCEGLLRDVENEFHHKLTPQEKELYLLLFFSIYLEGKK